MSAVLRVEGAERSFGSTRALAGASLELRRGEWLALLGPNGAGKTTLVRAVAGRVRLDSGEITLLGERLGGDHGDSRVRTRLGVVPQEIALYPKLTAKENLEVFGKLLGLAGPALHSRIDWALEWTALADRSNEPIERFSGGMKRRLNIACGVLHSPEVVLLDEPTVGVDPQSRERIWEMLEQLRRSGASLLLTTHQLDEAQQVCDRIVIVDRGVGVAAGTFEELVASTVGAGRRVVVTFAESPPESLIESESLVALENQEQTGLSLEARIKDVGEELPELLARIQTGGGRIADVEIVAPTLQAVFIHLTGRELRE